MRGCDVPRRASGGAARTEPRHHAQVRPPRVRRHPRRGGRSGRRSDRSCGSASSTTPRCSSRPSSSASSEAANALALDYAQARVVFDKPLSKFQVTRHKAVDMLQRIEMAKVGVHYAAWASDVDAPDREIAAAMAKSYTARSGELRHRGVHPDPRRRRLHVGVRRARLPAARQGERPAPRRPELATRTRRRPVLRGALGRICPSVGPAAPGGVRRSSSPDAKRPTRLSRAHASDLRYSP